eukprot:TRINITY_DN3987_c1_g2_i1.p1 TRINITY_DN3987_c1_g2~~TRINITY_DN3987_c1_g2_i1.p1  ORF type:complete len:945 (-),score=184.58 TRINITY_DN3987_c1_g2_i1:43-2838(-)
MASSFHQPLLVAACIAGVAKQAEAVIPQNTPLHIKQSGWCFDQQWSADPDQLILYSCEDHNNQEFTWRQEEGWDFFHLISNLADQCIGFTESDVKSISSDSGLGPNNDEPVVFKDCDASDDLIKWTYLYGTQQLQLTKFPTKCLDFSLTKKVFVAYDCKKDLGNFELRNQQMVFEKKKNYKGIKEGMPVEIQQVVTGSSGLDVGNLLQSAASAWSSMCLDQSQDSQTQDQLLLFGCKRSQNQLFQFTATSEVAKHSDVLNLNHIVTTKDSRCIGVGSATPQAGDPLVLKECSDKDKTINWRYAHGLEQIKLEAWPKLCMGIIDDHSKRMGVLKCHTNDQGWADTNQHFRVLDLGEKQIPEHVPLKITQNVWCLDQMFSAEPDKLILYSCEGSSNQQWIWRGSVTLGYHYLVSNLDDRCLGIDDKATASSGEPNLGAEIVFKACQTEDLLIRWEYVYSSQQFKLSKWPDLCMEYSEGVKTFVVQKCRFEEYVQLIGDSTYKQRFDVQRKADVHKLPVRLPVRIRVGTNFAWQDCLDRPPNSDDVAKWGCKEGATGMSINQEFLVRGNKSWHFSQLVSNVDLKCLAAAAAHDLAEVSFKECDANDDMMKWIYSQGKGFMKLAEYPDMCLGFTQASNKYTIQKCDFDQVGLAVPYQFMSVIDLGFHEIHEDKPQALMQNGWCLDRPYGQPTPGTSELNLFDCTGGDNQKFVWYNIFTWRHHYLLSHVDNLCLGATGSSKPSPHSPITFKQCKDDDPNIRWEYSYGLSQLKMSHWPDLCLDYDDSIKAFAVNPCSFLTGGEALVLWPAHNQVITFPGVEPKVEKDDDDDDDDDEVVDGSLLTHSRHSTLSSHGGLRRRRADHNSHLQRYEKQDIDGESDLDKSQSWIAVAAPRVFAASTVSLLLLAALLRVCRVCSMEPSTEHTVEDEDEQMLQT